MKKQIFVKQTPLSKFHNIILIVTIFLSILYSIGEAYYSFEFAEMFSWKNRGYELTELAFISFSLLHILSTIIFLILFGILVIKAIRKNLFNQNSVKSLLWMGHLKLISFIALLSRSIIMRISGNWDFIMYIPSNTIISLIALFGEVNLIYFISRLFIEAVDYKEENDLTV